jgi:ADP-heptose:LPS heptosyltransferase
MKKEISLVYHCGGLGDFLTTFPAVYLWNKQNPETRKILLGKPLYGQLGIDFCLFDEVWDAESVYFMPLYSENIELPEYLKQKLSNVKDVMLFAKEDSNIIEKFKKLNLRRFIFQKPFPDKRINITDYHLSIFDNINATKFIKNKLCFKTNISIKNSLEEININFKKYAVIHPGSGSKKKNWPVKNFFDLSLLLKEIKIPSLWILGPAEEEMKLPSEIKTLKNISLSFLYYIISNSILYIGNDSGISHLASLSKIPCVVLFGPSDPLIWAPKGENVFVINAKCIKNIFEQARQEKILNGICNKCEKSCIENITINEVYKACLELLKIN